MPTISVVFYIFMDRVVWEAMVEFKGGVVLDSCSYRSCCLQMTQ